jgi:hypothetical protein
MATLQISPLVTENQGRDITGQKVERLCVVGMIQYGGCKFGTAFVCSDDGSFL